MTKTIEMLLKLKEHCEAMLDIDECGNYGEYISAVDTAISVLKKEEERCIRRKMLTQIRR